MLRPVELAADVTVLPPYEYCLVASEPPAPAGTALSPAADAGGKEARAPEDGERRQGRTFRAPPPLWTVCSDTAKNEPAKNLQILQCIKM